MSFPPRVNTSVVTLTNHRGQGFTGWSSSVCVCFGVLVMLYLCREEGSVYSVVKNSELRSLLYFTLEKPSSKKAKHKSPNVFRRAHNRSVSMSFKPQIWFICGVKSNTVLNWKQKQKVHFQLFSNMMTIPIFSNTCFMTYITFHFFLHYKDP